eukprot:TRINITY_DN2204_c0_g1_i1.p1 TRINITY_DN2204_c0_g1~~TRINITY_DN2204_c0_g1_i1.p1  ORF type:complete len:386 (+),score=71.53 TRINITY_DN2204_c0_g1_i1:930-2087(+)
MAHPLLWHFDLNSSHNMDPWIQDDDVTDYSEIEALTASMCLFLDQDDELISSNTESWPGSLESWDRQPLAVTLPPAPPTQIPTGAIACLNQPRVSTSVSPSLSVSPPIALPAPLSAPASSSMADATVLQSSGHTQSSPLLTDAAKTAFTEHHLFVDNGNTFVGAQSMANGVMDLAVRVQVKDLARVLQQDQVCDTLQVAASRPSNPRICAAWRKAGYRVYNDLDGLTARQRVGKHVKQLLDRSSTPQTIIFSTGDGSIFAPLAAQAVHRGWKVVVFAWARCLSDKFKRLQLHKPDRVTIVLLDEYRNQVTFRASDRGHSAPQSPAISPGRAPQTAPAGSRSNHSHSRQRRRSHHGPPSPHAQAVSAHVHPARAVVNGTSRRPVVA